MSTYVMSDIHGCYDDFLAMLGRLGLSGDDRLILAGDYVDRGEQSLEMLRWLESCPPNVTVLKGNHDAEFAGYVRMLKLIDDKADLQTDPNSNRDLQVLLDTVRYTIRSKAGEMMGYFDYYGTVDSLIMTKGVTLDDMSRWMEMIDRLPYLERFECGGRQCVVVHAGFCDEASLAASGHTSPEDFYIYAREEGMRIGGLSHGMVIFGHTPTIAKDSGFYNDGNVFRYHDTAKDCIFYDIDCGCVFRGRYPSAKLACLRVDDEEVFYL